MACSHLVVVMSTQVVQMPVLVLLMMTIALVLKVVTLGQSTELLALSTREWCWRHPSSLPLYIYIHTIIHVCARIHKRATLGTSEHALTRGLAVYFSLSLAPSVFLPLSPAISPCLPLPTSPGFTHTHTHTHTRKHTFTQIHNNIHDSHLAPLSFMSTLTSSYKDSVPISWK